MQVQFRHVDIGERFIFKGQEYIKTNFQRGYYWQGGRKAFLTFHKNHIVDYIIQETPLTNWMKVRDK